MKPRQLNLFAANITSQNGEDGIINEIFQRIGAGTKKCVEFGAWDGKYLSNTWTLWHDKGWSALLIEGDYDRYLSLSESLYGFPAVSAIHAYVSLAENSALDSLLHGAGWLHDRIDLLSIDIDGDDFHIWKSLNHIRPRVVVIEYNPTIPPEIELFQYPGCYFGASAASLARLGHEKGYKLVSCTATNCIFVCNEDFPALEIDDFDLKYEFDRSRLSYIINAYDGRTFLTSNPIYSHPIPIASFAYWWKRLVNNLFSSEKVLEIPAKSILPVSLVAETGRQQHGLWNRVFAASKTNGLSLLNGLHSKMLSLPPYSLCARCAGIANKTNRDNRLLSLWRHNGSPLPPPHIYKQRLLVQFARRYRLQTLVETGTYMGDMISAMLKRFRTIISIELSADLHQQAQSRFAGEANVILLQGDSSIVLLEVLNEITAPTLFWLDGHYSAGNTALGDKETPISAEVEAILKHSVKGHVILIDDARNFDGTHDYPTLAMLRQAVITQHPSAKFTVSDDIIRIAL